jgi:MYXO-CTERM domain-containing protein
VGDNDPDLVEDWYTSIWAYNGLAYSNNPNNPNLTPGRGPYNPKNGGSYTYQERVFGWMEFPPADGRWASLAPAYPNRGDVGTTGSPPALPEPSCASPTSCASTRGTHASSCGATPPPVDGGPNPADGGPNPADGGPNPADGGIGAQADTGGGCSCRSGVGGSSGAGGALSILAMAWLVRRRRQRSPRESSSTARKTFSTRSSSS